VILKHISINSMVTDPLTKPIVRWLELKSAFYQGFISSFCTWSINNSLTKACFIITYLII
jgi:hypothetical protein